MVRRDEPLPLDPKAAGALDTETVLMVDPPDERCHEA